jgi:hypothetical protein
VYKQIRKTRIIAGLLELPQPGREEKLLLELPDGGPGGSGRALLRTACACPCELHLRFTERLCRGREKTMTVLSILGAGACLQGKRDDASAVEEDFSGIWHLFEGMEAAPPRCFMETEK